MRVLTIGAGVVGIATAVAFAKRGHSVIILEKEKRHGSATSSRNSEVIHAGIYYDPGSLKARLCVAGRQLLYDYLTRLDLPHSRCGKLIVAHDPAETAQLELLAARAETNGVADLRLLNRAQLTRLEPCVAGHAALLSPSTGILSVHDLMNALVAELTALGGLLVTRTRVRAAERAAAGWRLYVDGAAGGDAIEADIVVNAAGLYADEVAALIMPLPPDLQLDWVKGSYFALRRSAPRAARLVYPCPEPRGLGIHLTIDLAGEQRLGPDIEVLTSRVEAYDVDEQRAGHFCCAAQRYLPGITRADLTPGYSGIRGQRSLAGFRDFYIAEETARGAPGWINLIGIESPGLTASLAIGDYAAELIHA